MASTNDTALATPPTTPPATPSKAQVLTDVLALATQFSTCVEAFNLIHPHRDSDHAQKVALAKIGIQQGRLLIFGDVVGISSPPATIARHMVPSHPGPTNPDPDLPVNFGIRDARLDEEGYNEKVRAALNEIAGRPSHLTREEMMEKYGLKTPKRLNSIEHPALDTNRLEAFREKYALLQDLARSSGIRAGLKRSGSMTMSHWTVRDVSRFEEFVRTVRLEVDGLIALMGVKEQVDRGMRTDIKAMAWHPDLSVPVVRKDWEKLRLIREAVATDYPEYVEVADKAIKYINEELKESRVSGRRTAYQPSMPLRTKADEEKSNPKISEQSLKTPEKDKRPGFLSHFRFMSWGKSQKARSQSLASPTTPSQQDPQRSLSEDIPKPSVDENSLEPVRSKSLSAIPDQPAPLNLDSRLHTVPTQDAKDTVDVDTQLAAVPTHQDGDDDVDPLDKSPLALAATANSLVDRHDMYMGVGRIETKDIREKSKQAAGAWVEP